MVVVCPSVIVVCPSVVGVVVGVVRVVGVVVRSCRSWLSVSVSCRSCRGLSVRSCRSSRLQTELSEEFVRPLSELSVGVVDCRLRRLRAD